MSRARSKSSTLRNLGDSIQGILRNIPEGSRHLNDSEDPDYAYLPLSNTSPVRTRPPLSGLFSHDDVNDISDDATPLTNSATTSPSQPSFPDVESGAAQIQLITRDKSGISIQWLYASIAAVAYVYSLDQNVTSNYLPIATSAFNHHSILGTIYTAESIMNAVAKPFIAKIANVTSRPTAYSVTLAFYVLGYLLVAGSTVIGEVVAGMLLYTVGHSGLNLVTELLAADLSSLKWRGLVLSLTSLPFLINTFVGAEIVSSIVSSGRWRWGYGMFAIILPAVMLPAIFVLRQKRTFAASSAQRRRWQQSQHGEVIEEPSYFQTVQDFMIKMDFGGLLLIAISFAFLLLPLTLAKSANRAWNSSLMLSMEATGVALLAAFILYERFYTSHPLMPSRILVNRAFLVIVSVDFFYFMSGSLRSNYLTSYVYIVKDWSTREWTYFNNATTFTLCIFGPIAGLVLRYTHRFKALQIIGLTIRVLAMFLMVHGGKAEGSSLELISTQVLLGIGGAFNVVSSRVASQASVPHQDLASVIALLSLWTQLGGSVGSAIATRVWTTSMPSNLARELPDLSKEAIDKLYGDITAVREYPYNHPIRQGVIRAYEDTVSPLWTSALIIAMLPVIAAMFLPNYYLGDAHNAVEGGPDGRLAAGSGQIQLPEEGAAAGASVDESQQDEGEEGRARETSLLLKSARPSSSN